MEDEDGEYRTKEDRDHRTAAENEKLRVTWNTERRCYMENSAVKRFTSKAIFRFHASLIGWTEI